jgi:translocation and assembly module TamA
MNGTQDFGPAPNMRSPPSPYPGPPGALLLAAMLLLLVLHGCATRDDADGKAGRRGGANYAFEIEAPGDLAKEIRGKTLVGRWQSRDDYDPIQFDGLVAQLDQEVQAILRADGYFSARVEITSSPERVSVKVAPGQRTTVSALELKLDGPGKDDPAFADLLEKQWTLKRGAAYRSAQWEGGKGAVIETLHRQGYLRAKVAHSEARIDVPQASAALSATFDTGPRLAFGELAIEGLERYDASIIENLRPFRTGTPYTAAELEEFQIRLRAAGYFSSVSALPELIALERDTAATQVPIRVIVSELERRRVVLGAGFSTDEGPRGQVGFEHRDLDLLGRKLQMQSALIVSAKRQRMFANFRTPYDENGRFIGFGQRIEREDIQDLETLRSNTYTGFGQRSGSVESFTSLQYQFESERIPPGNGAPAERNTLRALVLGKAWDVTRLDNTLDPRAGYALNLQVSGAREELLSTASFARVYARGIHFLPMAGDGFFRDDILVGRAELGVVAASSREGIPSENLFRTGGHNTIRGYELDSLGVVRGGAIVGGRYLALVSVEYQHWITPTYAAAAFVDYGNAADSRAELKPVAGIGVGARMRTPIGPIKLDLAYGEARSRFHVHFSIGHTF